MSEVSFDDPPTEAGHFSFSQLRLFLQCGEAYRQKYLLMKDWPMGMGATAGKAFHTAIQHLLKEWKPNESAQDHQKRVFEATIMYDDFWNKTPRDKLIDSPEQETFDRARESMFPLAQLAAAKFGPALKPKEVEHKFQVNIGFNVVGFIDMIGEDGTIVDWKTGATSIGPDAAHKNRQLTLYDFAFRSENGGRPPAKIGIVWAGAQAKGPKFVASWAQPRQQEDFDRLASAFSTLDKTIRQDGPWRPAEDGSWMCRAERCPAYADCKVRA